MERGGADQLVTILAPSQPPSDARWWWGHSGPRPAPLGTAAPATAIRKWRRPRVDGRRAEREGRRRREREGRRRRDREGRRRRRWRRRHDWDRRWRRRHWRMHPPARRQRGDPAPDRHHHRAVDGRRRRIRRELAARPPPRLDLVLRGRRTQLGTSSRAPGEARESVCLLGRRAHAPPLGPDDGPG